MRNAIKTTMLAINKMTIVPLRMILFTSKYELNCSLQTYCDLLALEAILLTLCIGLAHINGFNLMLHILHGKERLPQKRNGSRK